MKTFNFISGLPRSGSTLLANILNQNPRFHASSTSGILEVMFHIRNTWDTLIEFKATPNEAGKKRVLSGILQSYYADVDKPIIFDKSRGWLSVLEMVEETVSKDFKVLVPVRDIRDVLSSFEKLWRKDSRTRQIDIEKDRYFDFQNIKSRTAVWLEKTQPVGLAYSRVKDAMARGFKDKMHFVRFEELTSRPKETMAKIHVFLGEEPFDYDFDHVKQLNHENDEVFGFTGLHTIREKVESLEPQWPTVLGAWANDYKHLNFW